jgi:cytochrome c551/c552
VIAALSTSHKIGLIVVAAVFISFALASSFLAPKRNADYPGARLKLFIGACVVLFAAMLSAVVVFGAEPKSTVARGGETTAPTSTAASSGTTTQAAATGDPAKGEALYKGSLGCSGCHSIDGTFIAGPTFKGLAGSTVTLSDGSTVTADHAYLLQSIEDPAAKVVKCANCGPPSPMASIITPGKVSPQQAEDLVAYIETLK